jgi:Rrf2 family transcriptional regulator, iron-sulfur cluster assembly transcription factor
VLYSNACEYALRALTQLAGRPAGEVVRLQELARAEEIPAPFLAKIVQGVVRAGLLRSTRGRGGGLALARPAGTITLLDVKRAVDGTGDLEGCAVGLARCSDEMPCPQHETWKPLREAIKQYLATTTLADMATALAEKRALLEGEGEGEGEGEEPLSRSG